jgi:hypothetical protein
MANRYANLVGSNKIKDEYTKINTGFDTIQAEVDAINTELDEKADRAFARVNGLTASTKDDTLNIAGGTGITISENPNTKTVTVTATGTATPGAHGSAHTEFGSDPIPNATTAEGGLMSAADKAVLDELSIKVSDFAVSVVEKGADKTGVADSAPAFQDAFNAVRDNGGGTVFVPFGEYKLGSLLRIYKNTRFIIEPGTRLIRNHSGMFLTNGDQGAEYPGYSGHGNIVIDGGIWDGNVTNFPESFDAFGIARGANIIIRNVEFRDVVDYHAIDLCACRDVIIENCRFVGFINTGGREYSEAIQIQEHTSEGFGQFGPFDATPCLNITVRNCYFGASETPGTQAWATGIGHHSRVKDEYNEGIKVIGNYFDGLTYVAVRPMKYNDVIIENNKFINCQDAVRFSQADGNGVHDEGIPQAGKNYIIRNNFFKNIAGECIDVYSYENAKAQNIIITGNVFELDSPGSSNCVQLRFVHNAHISNNTFKNVQNGVVVWYGSSVNINSNSFNDTVRNAITVTEPDTQYRFKGYTKGVNIKDNVINRCGRIGIHVAFTEEFSVENNKIIEPGTETDDTYNGITCGASAANGIVAHNRVIMAASGNQNRNGIEVTGTCSNVRVFDNDAEGKTRRTSVTTANGCFEGFFLASPNGTRYKVTVTDAGAISVTAG